jgi:hypothetical protein
MSKTKTIETNETATAIVVTAIDQIVSSTTLNTSQKIRALATEGLSRGAIAKVLNKRYQHVRNVLITPIKKT